jgi:hypothetical protein
MHVPTTLRSRLPIAMAVLVVLAVVAVVVATNSSTPTNHARNAANAAADPRAGAGADHPESPGRSDPPASPGSASATDPPANTSPATEPTLLATPPPRGRPVIVSIGSRPTGPAVPTDFMGLSFEVRSLPVIATYAGKGDFATLLRSLGPGVMRFGGISADEQAAWVPAGASKPAWANTAIDEKDLAGIAALAKETGWKVLLTVNLGHYELKAAAQEAALAKARLGPYLAGIEIGNEPDRFPLTHLRPPGTGVKAYLPQAETYRAAIEAAAPGTPIAGPDPSTGTQGLTWLRDEAQTIHPQLLTDHYYPLSSCGASPTISELLSPSVRRKESEMLSKMLTLARTYATPLRMDETNDISCEGEPGVSDAFASALWALDYTARAMTAGVIGMNFHDLIDQPRTYSALAAHGESALNAGDLQPAPEWYALLAAHVFMGAMGAHPPGRPLPTTTVGTTPGELSAHAMEAPDGKVSLVLVNYDPPGTKPLAVRLLADLRSVPRALAGGSILRLTAPSPSATMGTRLGGRAVAANGAWTAPSALPAVYRRAGALSLQIAPSSAAVVTLAPRRHLGRAALGR